LAGLRVIIVEDEPKLALCFEEVIEDEGGSVAGMAATVAAAIRSLPELHRKL
jgi:response regulator of citrate/malate metabolism